MRFSKRMNSNILIEYLVNPVENSTSYPPFLNSHLSHFTSHISSPIPYLYLMPIRSTICFLMCSLCLAFSAKAQKSSTDFVSTWVTDRADLKVINDSSIIIFVNPAYAYKFDIDWENDGIFDDTSVTTNIQHQYPRLDTFTIRIRGTFPHIYFGRQPGNSPKLLAIEQWGRLPLEKHGGIFFLHQHVDQRYLAYSIRQRTFLRSHL